MTSFNSLLSPPAKDMRLGAEADLSREGKVELKRVERETKAEEMSSPGPSAEGEQARAEHERRKGKEPCCIVGQPSASTPARRQSRAVLAK